MLPVDPINEAAFVDRIVLVTGASRGLGFEVCRQLARYGARVILTARDPAAAAAAAAAAALQLGLHRHAVTSMELDVRSGASVQSCRDSALKAFARIDIVVNNAGVFVDDPRRERFDPRQVRPEDLWDTLDVNLVGAYRVVEAFLPSMREHGFGRIVNVSSGMGRIVELAGDSLCYRTSKAALNTMTRILGLREQCSNIKINAVCPGWVRTDMGGPHAVRDASHGAYGILRAASLPDDGPTGELFRDGERFGW